MSTELHVKVCNLSKRFGAVQALSDLNIHFHHGEVVALLGDNGAGKSTLVSILSGVQQPDTGSIEIDGKSVSLGSPIAARAAGIVTVYQDLALVPDRDVVANIFLGQEITRWRIFVKHKLMRERTREIIDRLQVSLPDEDTLVKLLSGGQRQAVAIARAIVSGSPQLVIMDEPSAALGVREARRVTELISALRSEGKSVLLISHNIPSVVELADRIVLLKLGTCVFNKLARETSSTEIVSILMNQEKAYHYVEKQDNS